MWELWNYQDLRKDIAATSRLKKRAGSVNLVNDLQQIKDTSAQQQPVYSKVDKTNRTRGISDNKRDERQYERSKKIAKKPTFPKRQEATITPIHKERSKPKSFKLPTRLKDLLKEDGSND
ncbi:hypothetical protein [Terasakiella pusilla]|uniref:hypothetical protein n=1 Tax=Terasakiella pusilla TaxID=64973 RepID=UPI001F0A6E29|nr:hypothetical protein [Terasakiella pusilla]